ncbi:MAG TPA: PQQ-dependent dehydrogenase, methanol/ethanol family [Bryobacteraceae bacterium]|nr:PQQ-dependent dehydrogenase, methanol/ethanol family [Bryobacteraceae bacterium]
MKAATLLLAAALACAAQAPYERILGAGSDPGNWLTYSGNYSGQRYSALSQITAANVARLKPAWVYQTADSSKFETSPIIADGIVYISEPPTGAAALDARTGRPLWSYRREMPRDIRPCCGEVNRGLAILGDTLFLGTLDAHLVALDMRTGKVRWDVAVADYKTGYAVTVAPLALKDRIIVGIAGGEYGVRGYLDAYDPETGNRLWRFWTVPGPGEPGHETWAGESWKTGAATTWVTGSYDPAANLIYWGTGNPGPDYNGDIRRGDNLYAASLIALDAATGKLKWHFQFTPHDVHDWDSTHVPVLADLAVRGATRGVVMVANRNGFYYVLDRLTGEFLAGTQFAKQTWASGIDSRGKPVILPGKAPTEEGNIVYPGMHGGTNWFSPSYSPKTGLFYVATREEGTRFYIDKSKYAAGQWYAGGGIAGIPGVEPGGWIRALHADTGQLAWEFKLHSPPWAGLLSTAGGVVFGGTSEGYFLALDAATGKPLWRFPTGGAIFANPVSFLLGGKQHVAIAAGHALFVFALE